MVAISQAVKKTIAYSRFFNFPLTAKEIHYWLISPKIYSYQQLKRFLPEKTSLSDQDLRNKLANTTKTKLAVASKALRLIKIFPTVKLCALSGSVAIGNPDVDDDIDFLIITSSHTLWLTRLLLIPLISLFFARRQPGDNHRPNSLCFNLWLDEDALTVPEKKHSLYLAHELLQIKPLFDRDHTYLQFLQSNSWAKNHLANAYQFLTQNKPLLDRKGTKANLILKFLNRLCFKLQHFYMHAKITGELITLHQAYFHPRDLTITINSFLAKKLTK
jgi:hypothetical protein